MNKLMRWYNYNHTEVTWFLIGLLFCSGLDSLKVGDYASTLINFGLAFLNYSFNKKASK